MGFENRYRCKDGSYRWLSWNSFPLMEARLLFSVVRDVTAQKMADEALRRLNMELEQRVMDRTAQLQASNRELESFSYSVSHDLKAPLRAIDGFSRIIEEEHLAGLDEEAQRALGIIRKNAGQMGRLIEDLLSFSRLNRQPVNRVAVDMNSMIDEVWSGLEPERGDRPIEFVRAPLPPCEGDPVLLRQVWMNLLANAVKFTKGRAPAKIEVGLATVFRREDGSGVPAMAKPAYFVKDNGVGFDMKYYGKLFGVFQRLHRAEDFEGTGVGLAIVQRVVHRHGGEVWAEAEAGEGATFFVAL